MSELAGTPWAGVGYDVGLPFGLPRLPRFDSLSGLRAPKEGTAAGPPRLEELLYNRPPRVAEAPAAQGQPQPPVHLGVSPIPGISPQNYHVVRGVINGQRPHSDFAALPDSERRAAVEFYRTVEEAGVATNPDPLRRQVQAAFNQARADFLQRGGAAPGNFNDWVLRNYPAIWVRDNLPQVWRAFLEGRNPGS